jgi:hypothetical protein
MVGALASPTILGSLHQSPKSYAKELDWALSAIAALATPVQRAHWPEVTNPETRPAGSPDTCRVFKSDLAARSGVSIPGPQLQGPGHLQLNKIPLDIGPPAVLLRCRRPAGIGAG